MSRLLWLIVLASCASPSSLPSPGVDAPITRQTVLALWQTRLVEQPYSGTGGERRKLINLEVKRGTRETTYLLDSAAFAEVYELTVVGQTIQNVVLIVRSSNGNEPSCRTQPAFAEVYIVSDAGITREKVSHWLNRPRIKRLQIGVELSGESCDCGRGAALRRLLVDARGRIDDCRE